MDSALTTVGLPIALGIIMFGLGLDLTVEDFRRVARRPKAAAAALFCQLLVLPALCFGIVLVLDLQPMIAIGMMLLAASPGGTTANLFSHLFRGDVALNISLTAVNSLLALVTLPLITNATITWFGLGDSVRLPFDEVVQVFAIVLVPVGFGMAIHRLRPGFAARMERPVRVGSAVVLGLLVAGILFDQRDNVVDYLTQVGPAATLLCSLSLVIGFLVPTALGIPRRAAVASSMEVGVHNSTLAIFVAVEILGSVQISVPAAVYSIIMFVLATVWGLILTRLGGREAPARELSPGA